jgi:hydroxymethylpyrimidine/phosphomethylpyrimidine kinase
VTPNLPEAEKLLGKKLEMGEAARAIADKFGARAVLLKGGHAPESNEVRDMLWDGAQLHTFVAPRVPGIEVRGTGCMLASAVAAQRAQNILLPDAVAAAKTWLTGQIQSAQQIGKGRRVAVRA